MPGIVITEHRTCRRRTESSAKRELSPAMPEKTPRSRSRATRQPPEPGRCQSKAITLPSAGVPLPGSRPGGFLPARSAHIAACTPGLCPPSGLQAGGTAHVPLAGETGGTLFWGGVSVFRGKVSVFRGKVAVSPGGTAPRSRRVDRAPEGADSHPGDLTALLKEPIRIEEPCRRIVRTTLLHATTLLPGAAKQPGSSGPRPARALSRSRDRPSLKRAAMPPRSHAAARSHAALRPGSLSWSGRGARR